MFICHVAQLSSEPQKGDFCLKPLFGVFADLNSSNYPEDGPFYQISIPAFILELWPVEVSDLTNIL